MKDLALELRRAARRLAKTPLFSIIAVAVLGIGVASTTAVFTLVNATLLRPLAVDDPARLVDVHLTTASRRGGASHLNVADLRERSRALAQLAAATERTMNLSEGGRPELVLGVLVSANYFSTLGVRPALGRFFLPEEDVAPGTHPVAVISEPLWRRRFGSDSSAIGRAIRLNGHPFTVVGVAPRGFSGTFIGAPFDVWMPVMMAPVVRPRGARLDDRGSGFLELVGRLAPRATVAMAQSELSRIALELAREYPRENEGLSIEVRPTTGVDAELRDGLVSLLAVLLVVAALVMSIGCVNVAGMLLTRASARLRDIAIRVALGASPRRLAGEMLVESLLLSLVAAVAGLALSRWAIGALRAFEPPFDLRLRLELSPDARVAAFTTVIATVVGIACGLTPALQASRTDVVTTLRARAAGSGSRRSRLRDGLLIGQVALSLVLLIGAGLFRRALDRAASVDPGFSTAAVSVATLDLSHGGYDAVRGTRLFATIVDRVASLPGVDAVGLTSRVPLGLGTETRDAVIPGHEAAPGKPAHEIDHAAIAPGYLDAMGIALIQGREFTRGDIPGTLPVALINSEMERRAWPSGGALGRTLSLGDTTVTIVGVTETTMYRRLGESPRPFVYRPLAQAYTPGATLVVRTHNRTGGIESAIARALGSVDAELPPAVVRPLARHIGAALLPQRLAGAVSGVLGAIGLVLALAGLYASVAFSAAQRTREIGIRVALGATRSNVIGVVIGRTLALTAIGLVIGVAIAAVAAPALGRFLLGVSSLDVATFVAVPALLACAAAMAGLFPAWRSTRVSPVVALRQD